MRVLLAFVLGLMLAAETAEQPKPVYLDVRTPAEWAAGHVKGAILLPVEQLPERWQELERYRDRPIIIYCRTGRRAGVALDLLRKNGFEHVENGGGLTQMAARGLQIVKGAGT